MDIIETPVFTKLVAKLFSEIDYVNFKNNLIFDPEKGERIKGGGGLRKIRWGKNGKGKRGGIRIIYILLNAKIYLLYGYPKNKQDNLTKKQKEQLKQIAKKLEVVI